jgi:hypothetical protein
MRTGDLRFSGRVTAQGTAHVPFADILIGEKEWGIHEDEHGKTCVEYDKPSSLFGQFGNAKVTEVAAMLDRKLEQLVAKASS